MIIMNVLSAAPKYNIVSKARREHTIQKFIGVSDKEDPNPPNLVAPGILREQLLMSNIIYTLVFWYIKISQYTSNDKCTDRI